MSSVCHFSNVTHRYDIHGKGYLMLHHLPGATLQVAHLVNYNCHPLGTYVSGLMMEASHDPSNENPTSKTENEFV